MIDENKTFELYGHTSIELSKGSGKYIIRVCDICGKVDWVKYKTFKNAKHPNLCQSCWQIGRKVSNKTRELKSELFKGRNNPNYDKLMSDEQKEKISKSHKGKQVSKETKIKISCTAQGITRAEFTEFLTDHKYCKLFNNEFKEKIREKFHNKCYLCDKKQDRKLSVHHVNYNKLCLCGAACEFIPLCGSCHTKTNHNRQYWEDMIMCYLYPNRYFMIDI